VHPIHKNIGTEDKVLMGGGLQNGGIIANGGDKAVGAQPLNQMVLTTLP